MKYVLAILGAVVGYAAWLVMMLLFAAVCRGIGNVLFCGGAGGPNMLDLLTLPVAVIGGAVLGYGLLDGKKDYRS